MDTIYQSLFHSSPYRIGVLQEFNDNEEIINIGRKLISDIKWNGVANIDFLVDKRDKSKRILEFNPRFWQSLLGSANAGVNFPLLYCQDAMGVKSSYTKRQSFFASPSMYPKILFDRLKGSKAYEKIRWSEIGMKFTFSDPMPEMVHLAQMTGSKIKQKFKRKK